MIIQRISTQTGFSREVIQIEAVGDKIESKFLADIPLCWMPDRVPEERDYHSEIKAAEAIIGIYEALNYVH